MRASFARELRRARELELSYFHTVRALAAAVEAKDGYTGEHIQRVHEIGLLLARAVAPGPGRPTRSSPTASCCTTSASSRSPTPC